MNVKNMLVVQDASGEIVAAQILEPTDGEINVFIAPVAPDHTLSEVSDVPAEIYELDHPDKFPRALAEYVNSQPAKVRATNPERIREAMLGHDLYRK